MSRILLLATALLLARPSSGAERVVSEPAANSPEAAVAQAFEAAVAGDFAQYLETIHPEHRTTSDERASRQKYEWTRFVGQHTWYLRGNSPPTFVVVSERTDGERVMRVFIKDLIHADRMPVPVRLKRDGSAWKIVVNSL